MSQPKPSSGAQSPRGQASERDRIVSIVLWVAAGVMVLLLVALFIRTQPDLPFLQKATATVAPVEIKPTQSSDSQAQAVPAASLSQKAVVRALNPHTVLPAATRKEAIEYKVGDGDSLFALSKQFDLEPETIFWANFDTLGGSPDMISPGIDLIIPPEDGVYYQWKEGDTLQSVADEFKADPDAILESPSINSISPTRS